MQTWDSLGKKELFSLTQTRKWNISDEANVKLFLNYLSANQQSTSDPQAMISHASSSTSALLSQSKPPMALKTSKADNERTLYMCVHYNDISERLLRHCRCQRVAESIRKPRHVRIICFNDPHLGPESRKTESENRCYWLRSSGGSKGFCFHGKFSLSSNFQPATLPRLLD